MHSEISIYTVLLGLYVINLGMAFGAGLYENRIVLPMWFVKQGTGIHVDAEAIRTTDTGRRFWAFVGTVPLTLLTLAGLVISARISGAAGTWWFVASLMVLVERVLTFAYFIPNIIRFVKPGATDPNTISKKARQWMRMNWVRMALNLAGLLAALMAFSMIRMAN